MPAVLKNAVDVLHVLTITALSPESLLSFATVSPGSLCGFGANHQVRQTPTGFGVNLMRTPDIYLAASPPSSMTMEWS